MIAALLCASLVAQVQDPPRITIEQRALRADVALRKIGEKFGVKLAPDRTTRNDVLLAYLPDVTFTEFRERTAQGWNANWRQSENGWVLQRTRQQVRNEEITYEKYKANALRKYIAKWSAIEPMNQALAERYADRIVDAGPQNLFQSFDPKDDNLGVRALRRVLRDIGPASLAKMSKNTSALYATVQGTPGHPALARALETYGADNAAVRAALASRGELDTLENYVNEYGFGGQLRRTLSVSKPCTDMVLTINAVADVLLVTLLGFDNEGIETFAVQQMVYAVDRYDSGLPGDTSLQFSLSPEATKVTEAYKALPGWMEEGEVNPLLVKLWSNFPEDDPVAYEYSETLLALARSLGRGVVARLSDELLDSGPVKDFARPQEDEEDHSERLLTRNAGFFARLHRFTIEPDMLIVEPREPSSARYVFPREGVARFCTIAQGAQGATVFDLARLYASVQSTDWFYAKEYFEELVRDNAGLKNSFFGDEALALVGSLTDGQYQAALLPQGVTLRLSETCPAFKGIVRQFLQVLKYWSSVPGNSSGFEYDDERRKNIRGVVAFSLLDGVPAESTVNVKVAHNPYVYYRDPEDEGSIEDIDYAAYRYYVNEDVDVDDEVSGDGWLAKQRFYFGSSMNIAYAIDFGGNTMAIEYDLITSTGDGRPYRFSDLPPQLRIEFWKTVEEERRP
ncbi:MAG: hypothetical protein IH945_07885 [Armatimonadetes bacterium]|nr:hypothetical protein [Armatimonadota bacterium]